MNEQTNRLPGIHAYIFSCQETETSAAPEDKESLFTRHLVEEIQRSDCPSINEAYKQVETKFKDNQLRHEVNFWKYSIQTPEHHQIQPTSFFEWQPFR